MKIIADCSPTYDDGEQRKTEMIYNYRLELSCAAILTHRLFKVAGTVYGVVFIVTSLAMYIYIDTLKLVNKKIRNDELVKWVIWEMCLLKKLQYSNSPAPALRCLYLPVHPVAFMSRWMINSFTYNKYNYQSFFTSYYQKLRSMMEEGQSVALQPLHSLSKAACWHNDLKHNPSM